MGLTVGGDWRFTENQPPMQYAIAYDLRMIGSVQGAAIVPDDDVARSPGMAM